MNDESKAASERRAGMGDDWRIDRRSLLAVGASAAMLGLARPVLAQGVVQPAIRYVITDRGYPASLEFGRVLESRGAARLEIAGGLTDLWQKHLVPHWQEPDGAVAGLTSREVWNCLAEQARGQFRKSRLVGCHTIDVRTGMATHVVTAPNPVLPASETDGFPDSAWPAAVARLVDHCLPLSNTCLGEARSGRRLPAAALTHSLVSWIIA